MFTSTCSRMQTRMRTHASTHFFLDRFDPVILEHTPPVIIAICRYAICRRISCPYCTVVYHFSNLIQHDRVCTAIWLRITYLSTSRQSCWNCNLCVRACRAVCAVSACACRACVRPCVQVCMRAHTCMCMRHCFFFFSNLTIGVLPSDRAPPNHLTIRFRRHREIRIGTPQLVLSCQ